MTDNELFGISEQLDDIISRADVVDEIEGVDWYHINKNGEMVHGANDAEHQAWYKADDIYAAIKRVTSAQQWISCEERLPDAECGESDTVLTTCGYRDVEDTSVRWIRLLYFNGGVWCYPTGETYEQKVVAWMPLPKPWKEEKDG